ncbi:coiled-coil domain-containing protein 34-like isoform X1 [Scyliorhinus canicula]|uniref:coiled-coil domain-containing protein 34-like isoform X1 n=1 Tax=Scyliorhinus canicula TaxID=7830 RepID=UPI0018F362FD|nr:coiled-coil domain-containing protein 34-like isoform X1 [Scyliorhinus canicula]XP_038664227.1 coiled-coil domain-containing protein 34-like isoform X1 [Scyliorhinus canicula]
MSSTLSEKDLKAQDSYSDPFERNRKSEIEIQSKSCDFSSSADSTSSLLSHINHESYESEDEENESPNKQTNRLSSSESKYMSWSWKDNASKEPVVSTPRGQKESRQNNWLKRENLHKSCDLEISRGSTTSLLSPIYHDSYESEGEIEAPMTPASGEVTPTAIRQKSAVRPKTSRFKTSLRKAQRSEEEEQRFKEVELTAWEKWLIKKAKEERVKIQNKSQQEVTLKQTKLKESEELEKKKILAEDEHKRWVLRKNEKDKMEKEIKLHKLQEEEKAKERARGLAAERASEKFQDWLKKKKLQKMETKKIEKNEEEKRTAETHERKEKADKIYQEWLEKVKTRPRTVPSSFGYVNGKLTGYYDGSSYPTPSYYNPIPWKPIPIPRSEDATKKGACKIKEKPKSTYLYGTHSNVAFRPKDNLIVGTARRKAR